MAPNKSQVIGSEAEEALRSYFWRAGFFALRGVPVQVDGEDVTDLDIWLYERPTGVVRGTQFVDAKHKGRPKAFERIVWSLGVSKALSIDRAYVATTDSRPSLRRFAKRVGVGLIDGRDLARIGEAYLKSDWKGTFLSEEELFALLRKTDQARKLRMLQDIHHDIKGTCAGGTSASSLVRALSFLGASARLAIHEYENTEPAEAAVRLVYLAAAIACVNLDSLLAESYFRSTAEKREHLVSGIRLGQSDPEEGMRPFRTALAMIEKYAPTTNAAKTVRAGLAEDLQAVPAEIVADAALSWSKGSQLFDLAREYYETAYGRKLLGFDSLGAPAKGLLGAMLDYSRVKRETFATRWLVTAAPPPKDLPTAEVGEKSPPLPLEQAAAAINGSNK